MEAGKLRIYIGAAAGVGCTYAMLDEGSRRQARGTKVVVGWVDTHQRPNTEALLTSLTGIHNNQQDFDTAELINRQPDVILIDDIGCKIGTDVPERFRWQEVEKLLAAGIDVIATASVQHIASLADIVNDITGECPQGFLPDRVLKLAEQIEIVDATPEAIRRRIAHGNVFGPDALRPRDADLFNSDSFARLRLLLIEWMTQHLGASERKNSELGERIVIAIRNPEEFKPLLHRVTRLASHTGATLLCVHVMSPHASEDRQKFHELNEQVKAIGGTFQQIVGTNIAETLASFATVENATQIVIGSSKRKWLRRPFTRPLVDQLSHLAPFVDVHIVKTENSNLPNMQGTNISLLSRRRKIAGFIFGFAFLSTLTTSLSINQSGLSVSTALTLSLLGVITTTAIGGLWPGISAAVIAPLLVNWFLIAPFHTLRINNFENIVELAVFVSVATIVSAFVSVNSRRTAEAKRAWREASALSALAESTAVEPLEGILDLLRETLNFDAVGLFPIGEQTTIFVSPNDLDNSLIISDTDVKVPINNEVVLVARGPVLSSDDHRILHAFTGQLSKALEQRRLRDLATEADTLAKADELRTAILRAVSHDLRSPLAGIKASVSSLRQTDIEWPAETQREFLASIESETDRLTSIVTNLLDLSRIEAGVLQPSLRDVSVEEIVPYVVQGFGNRSHLIGIENTGSLEDVYVDPALLERVLANLIDNALTWSGHEQPIVVRSHQSGNYVQVHIIDHGPGIPKDQKQKVRQAFHRLGDKRQYGGLGLGLAIADRLIVSMNGNLELRDTPGGGLTAVILLPVSRRFHP